MFVPPLLRADFASPHPAPPGGGEEDLSRVQWVLKWSDGISLCPCCQCRHIFFPGREQRVVSLSAVRPPPEYLPGVGGRSVQQAAQHAAALWTSALGVFFLTHNLIRCASFSAWALCPFHHHHHPAPRWLGLAEIPLLIWSLSSQSVFWAQPEEDAEGECGSALLPERGILIPVMHGQLAEGARSSPRVCVLVIYRQ